MEKDFNKANTLARYTHEVALSLNVGFAVMFAVATFLYSGVAPYRSAIFFLIPGERLFLYLAKEINSVLRLDSLSNIGREFAFTALLLVAAIIVFAILRLRGRTSIAVLHPIGGVLAFALVPAFWLYALQATWISEPALYPFWRSSQLSLFLLEVPVLCALVLLNEKRRFPSRFSIAILFVHYAWWTGIMWPFRLPLWSPKVLFVIFPFAGAAWLMFARNMGSRTNLIKPSRQAV